MKPGKRSKLMPGVIAAAALFLVGCDRERSSADRAGAGLEGRTAPTIAAAVTPAGAERTTPETGQARYWKPIE